MTIVVSVIAAQECAVQTVETNKRNHPRELRHPCDPDSDYDIPAPND